MCGVCGFINRNANQSTCKNKKSTIFKKKPDQYRVEKFLGKWVDGRTVRWLCKWDGYGSTHNSWELQSGMYQCDLLIQAGEAAIASNKWKNRGSQLWTVSSKFPVL